MAEPKYKQGQVVNWYTSPAVILGNHTDPSGQVFYQLKHVELPLLCRVSEKTLDEAQAKDLKPKCFRGHAASLVVVDKFYKDPDQVRAIALEQPFHENLKAYKGKRTTTQFLLPGVKEEFERLLGRPVHNWLNHKVNGA